MSVFRNAGEAWDSYNTEVLHKNAPEIQRRECKRAFYAGMIATLSMCFSDESTLTTEDIMNLQREILDFKEFQLNWKEIRG